MGSGKSHDEPIAAITHEQRFLLNEKQAILSTAVGVARLRLRTGDVQGASDALDDAVDRCHAEHWDACLADGWEAEKIEMLLGPRTKKVDRVPLARTEEPMTTVYCTHCQKAHVVRLDEEQCSPGAWLMAGERWPTDAR